MIGSTLSSLETIKVRLVKHNILEKISFRQYIVWDTMNLDGLKFLAILRFGDTSEQVKIKNFNINLFLSILLIPTVKSYPCLNQKSTLTFTANHRSIYQFEKLQLICLKPSRGFWVKRSKGLSPNFLLRLQNQKEQQEFLSKGF